MDLWQDHKAFGFICFKQSHNTSVGLTASTCVDFRCVSLKWYKAVTQVHQNSDDYAVMCSGAEVLLRSCTSPNRKSLLCNHPRKEHCKKYSKPDGNLKDLFFQCISVCIDKRIWIWLISRTFRKWQSKAWGTKMMFETFSNHMSMSGIQ